MLLRALNLFAILSLTFSFGLSLEASEFVEEWHFEANEGFPKGEAPTAEGWSFEGDVEAAASSAPTSRWRSLKFTEGGPSAAIRTFAGVSLPEQVFISWWVRPEVLAEETLDTLVLSETGPELVFVDNLDTPGEALDVYLTGTQNGAAVTPQKIAMVPGGFRNGWADEFYQCQWIVDPAAGSFSLFIGPEMVLSDHVWDLGGSLDAWGFSNQGIADTRIDHLVVSRSFVGDLALADMDADDLPNGWEIEHGYDWQVADDTFADLDGDGLTLFEEYILGSSDALSDPEAPTHGWLDQYYFGESFRGIDPALSFTGNMSPSSQGYFEADFESFDGFNFVERSEEFGRRLRGYLTPEESGNYTFWAIFNHHAEVRISLTGRPEDAELLTFTQGWNKRWMWEEYPGQKSLPVYLEAGQAYFVEVVSKGKKENEFMGLKWAHADWPEPVLIPASLVTPFTLLATDADDDGLPDAWEVENGLDPRSPWADHGAWGDPDEDGVPNEREHAFGFDPFVADLLEVPTRSAVLDLDGRLVSDDTAPWQSTTVGSQATGEAFGLDAGYAIIAEGESYALSANRAYLGWDDDGYHFLHQPLQAAFQLTARVDPEFLQHTGSFAGLSLVSELEPKGSRASVFLAGDGRVVTSTRELLRQPSEGHDPLQAGFGAPQSWLRLEWREGWVSFYRSEDGFAWSLYETRPFEPGESAQLGMFASAARPLTFVGAVFEEVSLRWDSDGDLLYDDDEVMLGTDPLSEDTDSDGYADGEESLTLLSDPLIHMDEAEVQHPSGWKVLRRLDIEAWEPTLGEWEVDAAGWLEAGSLNGRLALEWSMHQAFKRRISFPVKHRFSSGFDAERSVDFHIYVDGIFIETHRVAMPEAEVSYTVSTVLPFLSAGSHRLEVVWENMFFSRTIAVGPPTLDRPGNLDYWENNSWGAYMVAQSSGVLDDAEEVLSYVSPAQIEGYTPHIELMEAAEFHYFRSGSDRGLGLNAVKRLFRYPDMERDWVGPTGKYWLRKDIPIHPAEAGQWYAEVDLPADGSARRLHFGFEGGGKVSEVRARWLVTDALDTVDKTLRAGDSLLISAGPEAGRDGALVTLSLESVTGVVETLSFADTEPAVVRFDATTTVTASYRGQTASFTITAVPPALAPSSFIAAQRDRERAAVFTGVSAATTFSSSGLITDSGFDPATETVTLGIFSPAAEAPGHLVQRLRNDGRILGTTEVKTFWLRENPTGFFTLKNGGPGLNHGVSDIFTGGLPEGVAVTAEIFRAGVMFDDGLLTRSYWDTDFDAHGFRSFEVLIPVELGGSMCHHLLLFQDGERISKY